MNAIPEADDLVSVEVQKHIESMVEQLKISNFKLQIYPGSIRGDNYLGVIAKVVVKGENEKGKNVTLNLIVKSAPRQEIFRSLAPIRSIFEREILMYTEVFPEFEKLQQERCVSNPFTSLAKCYATVFEDLNEAIVMENMKELGYDLKDRHHTLDIEHVRLVLKEYGRYHALSFALKDQKPEVFEEIKKPLNSHFYSTFTEDQVIKYSEIQVERALNIFDPVNDKVMREKYQNFQNNIYKIMTELVDSKNVGKYGVITHSDCWMNNMLFKHGDPSQPDKPTNICFLDFQIATYASPVLDLSYFIFTTTDKKLRDQYYNLLIDDYYDSLSSFLRELGSDPESLYPYEVFQQHLKKYSVYGLNMATMIIYMMVSDVDEIPDVHNAGTEEQAVKMFGFKTKNEDQYRERMHGVMESFVQYGYI